jgi:hypothetical protein
MELAHGLVGGQPQESGRTQGALIDTEDRDGCESQDLPERG